jgi:hypothetical protein
MRKATMSLLMSLALCLTGNSQSTDPSSLKNEIVRLSQARFRAFATGDRTALRDMVADDAVFIYANGSLLDKSQMLDGVAKFPGGYDFHYEDVQFRNFQNSVMLCFRLVYNDSTAHDVETNQYLETDTFARRNGRWLLTGVHGTAVPYPKSHNIFLRPELLDDYVGWYEAGNQKYEITKQGTQLFGQRSGFPKVPWHAETENIFAVEDDVAGRRIFVRDKSGRVSQMIRIGPEHYRIWRRLDR